MNTEEKSEMADAVVLIAQILMIVLMFSFAVLIVGIVGGILYLLWLLLRSEA